jgi:hypothetical protein
VCVLARLADIVAHCGTSSLSCLPLNPFEFGENGQELVDAMGAHMPAEHGLSPMLR